jgi:hypothetical protein
MGISPSEGRYLHTGQHKNKINAHIHPCLKWDWNQRSQCSSGRRQFMPYTARPLRLALPSSIGLENNLFPSDLSTHIPYAFLSVASQYAIAVILLFLTPCSVPNFKSDQEFFWICSADRSKCLFQVFMVVHGPTEVVGGAFPEIVTRK